MCNVSTFLSFSLFGWSTLVPFVRIHSLTVCSEILFKQTKFFQKTQWLCLWSLLTFYCWVGACFVHRRCKGAGTGPFCTVTPSYWGIPSAEWWECATPIKPHHPSLTWPVTESDNTHWLNYQLKLLHSDYTVLCWFIASDFQNSHVYPISKWIIFL